MASTGTPTRERCKRHNSTPIPSSSLRRRPYYTLRALPESSSLELTLAVEVRQKSGENWNSIKLNLSTSSPSVGTAPTQLSPWEVDFYEPLPILREKADIREARTAGTIIAAVCPLLKPKKKLL